MRRKRILGASMGLAAILAFWPWYENPANFVNWKDRFKTSVPIALMLGGPCEKQEDGTVVRDIGPDCYRYSEPRHYSGIWLHQFEGSMFIEGAEKVPNERPDYKDSAWLQYDLPTRLNGSSTNDYDEGRDCYPIDAYRVRFVGRERFGGGGHFGMWEREIWPDRMIEMNPLPPPNCQSY